MRTIKTLTAIDGTKLRIRYDSEYEEFQVTVEGSPDATYFTDSRNDAESTAYVMLADVDSNATFH